ncbi:hypothetical protein [Mesorhizobium sp. M0684]|uniref:hypothetical protein n=1 Tax=Mesorhizobium sp. M0684 TaxID=2956986 RepID=UPI00333606E8
MAGQIESNVADAFTMAAVGDRLLARPVTNDHHPAWPSSQDIHPADFTFGNLETNILDVRSV